MLKVKIEYMLTMFVTKQFKVYWKTFEFRKKIIIFQLNFSWIKSVFKYFELIFSIFLQP